MTKKSRNVYVRIKASLLRTSQNIQRALEENYFSFVFTSESRIVSILKDLKISTT